MKPQQEFSFGTKQFTVSELTARIKSTLEPAFTQVWVKGEVSNYRPAASGHAYFSLKDSEATIAAAFFGWGQKSRSAARFELSDGLEVLCRGRISVYAPRGNYQFMVDQMEPLGAGALQLAFEQLKQKLAAEGLFDPARRRRLPEFPKRIAIVTSASGAALRDMLTILKRRSPQIAITVIPALVQGEQAPAQIIRGLEMANRHSLGEVVVLARGGGSIEDLWCFNDEGLARSIVASKLPVISAVGHEIDFSISDFVADLRAPTPSAAAEILSGHWVDVRNRLQEAKRSIWISIQRDLAQRKKLLEQIMARVVSPRDRIREQSQRVDDLALRMERAMEARLERGRSRLGQLAGKLEALSPLRVLERGYAIAVQDNEPARVVRSAGEVVSGNRLRVRFHDGEVRVEAI
ncbi:MAG: exodeoxyribonuclease VII large subunit [Oligoflexia bacterium]